MFEEIKSGFLREAHQRSSGLFENDTIVKVPGEFGSQASKLVKYWKLK